MELLGGRAVGGGRVARDGRGADRRGVGGAESSGSRRRRASGPQSGLQCLSHPEGNDACRAAARRLASAVRPSGRRRPPTPTRGSLGRGWLGGSLQPSSHRLGRNLGRELRKQPAPDQATGIGTWSEELFVESMRTGTHIGELRPFLPPMPTYSRLTDGELHAIFTYLRSLEPISNQVPAPLPPGPAAAGGGTDL
jgi:hypothetical protein